MHISSTGLIEGHRVLYSIGRIKGASSWHAANDSLLQDNCRKLALNELIRKAEDIGADAIVGIAYETDSIVSVDGARDGGQAFVRCMTRCFWETADLFKTH